MYWWKVYNNQRSIQVQTQHNNLVQHLSELGLGLLNTEYVYVNLPSEGSVNPPVSVFVLQLVDDEVVMTFNQMDASQAEYLSSTTYTISRGLDEDSYMEQAKGFLDQPIQDDDLLIPNPYLLMPVIRRLRTEEQPTSLDILHPGFPPDNHRIMTALNRAALSMRVFSEAVPAVNRSRSPAIR